MAHDNKIGFNENDQVFCISVEFWKMFEDRYHCDHVIQIRKYDNIEQITGAPIAQGPTFSAFEVVEG